VRAGRERRLRRRCRYRASRRPLRRDDGKIRRSWRRDHGKVRRSWRRDHGKVRPCVRRDDGKVGLVERSKSRREIRRQFAPSLSRAPLWRRAWCAAGDRLGRGRLVDGRGSGFGRRSNRRRSRSRDRRGGGRASGRCRREARRSRGCHWRSGRRSWGRHRRGGGRASARDRRRTRGCHWRSGRRSWGRHRRSGRRSWGRTRRSGRFGRDSRCDCRRSRGRAGGRMGHRRSGLSGRRTRRCHDKRMTAFGAPHLEAAGRNTAFVDLVGSLARLALDLEHV
jgi:hypothetical protein